MSNIGRPVDRPQTSESGQNGKHVSSPIFADNFPTLWEFLTKQRDLGELHKTGCLTLFADGVKLKVCLNDRPARSSCFVSGSGLLEVLARCDRGLLEGSLRWSKKGYQRRSRA